ncbi:chymotrypsinogen A-like [Epargyreus clarus]|uniref:chymotrypsinogen A-like n=1 Tax=Epargyreus clarus TaxID=520877 RepID=UPI003C2EAEA5
MMSLPLVLFVVSVWITGESREIKSADTVIAGGTVISVEESPFIAFYVCKNQKMTLTCGSNIISDRFLISAAHCYAENHIEQYIIAGTDVGPSGGNAAGKVNVEKAVMHPKYNSRTFSHDLLVIKLARSLQFSSRIQAIKMESHITSIPANSMLQTFGYGLSESNGPPRLRKASVPFVDEQSCRMKFYELQQTINEKTICAGTDGLVTCRGDSGGPLVYNNVLVGITSFGLGQCGLGPAVYTRVGALRHFIDQTIKSMS